jgi:heterodisulfide reductase subunit D
MTLPTVEKTRGAKPFDMTPFTLFLRRHLDRIRPLLRERVPMRIALHRHPGVHGVVEAAGEILRAVPGIEVVDLRQPAVGLQANNLRVLPQYRRRRRAGRGLSFRSSRIVCARARLAVPHHEFSGNRRRQHGAAS